MTRVCTKLLLTAVAVVLFGGCQHTKSANPLSPAVAGPIEGVVISNPHLLEPGQDWELKTRDQPVQLLIRNAGTNGTRPLTYTVEIASDADFKNIIFARTGVAPGSDDLTRLQLPDKLPAGRYWWRTRAEDGANTGPYSPVTSFQVLAQVILAPPTPSSPSNGTQVSGLVPEFRIRAGDRSGVTAEIDYIVQVGNNSSFSSIAATFTQKESWPETRIAPNYSFLYSRTYYWRVRAWHTADGSDVSNWSNVFTFRTPAPPVIEPPPPVNPPPGGGGGGGTGGGAACNSNDGEDIAACIEARYPQYLTANVSLSRRTSNMQFLRDRMIEHGKCRGLNLGLNRKRNTSVISNDFIVWRRSGQPDMGVDIARGYDDTDSKLRLMWHTFSASESYGHPFYKDYGSPSCN